MAPPPPPPLLLSATSKARCSRATAGGSVGTFCVCKWMYEGKG